MTGMHADGLPGLKNLWNAEAAKLLAPGVVGTCALFLVGTKLKANQFAIPLCMVAMPLVFYATVFVSGHSLEDARDAGWVAAAAPTPVFYEVFELFDFGKVDWAAAFPGIPPAFAAMCAVVAFGSSLDVAAIQFELGKPLDYDHEVCISTCSALTNGCLYH